MHSIRIFAVMKTMNIYCIPGMGVNERLFRNINVEGCQIHHIKWLTPIKNESLKDYAIRLSEQIDQSQPFCLLGVSFGGMCATEISKELQPYKTFLVSSSKTINEIPSIIKIWNKLPLYRSLSDKHYINGAILFKKQFGVNTKEQQERFLKMLQTAPKNYFKGAVHCIVSWKNKEYPDNIIHIHGDQDDILPHKKIKADYIIPGGSHFMIVNRANEINSIIKKELSCFWIKE